jgi:exonuclease VII large subunit
MAINTASVERLRGGVDMFVSKAVDATVHLPLGIYDRTREELRDVDAQRLRKTFEGLLEDFIDRGQDRVKPLERRLKREGRKAEAEISEAIDKAQRTTRELKKTAKRTTTRAQKTARKTTVRPSGPKPQRAAAPRAGELPIASYGSLTADEIVDRLDKLDESELETIKRYESETKMRSTVLERIDSLLS